MIKYDMISLNKTKCEFLRSQAKQKFDQVRGTWIELGKWALPHRIKWLLSQTEGERNNYHIVDPTHQIALRSTVAGFLEGNTSATRPWYRFGTDNPDIDMVPENHEWLDFFRTRTLKILSSSNFYHEAGYFYYDFNVVNTGAHYIDEIDGNLFFHTLIPGSYFVLNNSFGEAVVLVREFSLSVKALVDKYGKNGDWSNFSTSVKKMYQEGNYSQLIDVVQIVKENDDFEPGRPQGGVNRKWISVTYEVGGQRGPYYSEHLHGDEGPDPADKDKYLEIFTAKRKPFIVGASYRNGPFEYGEMGPTLDSLGLIKSLNKKAIAKDQALEQILKPAMQGPMSLRKSYVTSAPNSFVPLDAQTIAAKQKLTPIFEINPAIAPLLQDVSDMRQMVMKLYYADYLLYLSSNPKTRTKAEVDAIVQEQQLVIGPNLQSLNWTYNLPIVEYVSDFTLDTDPYLPPPPEQLASRFLRPEFVSVFAQAQRAADLPSIDRYMAMVTQVAQIDPKILDKANVDKLADLYEDRLYLPAGLNNPQAKVEAMREQAIAQAQRQQQMEQIAQLAGAAKDVGIKVQQNGGEG